MIRKLKLAFPLVFLMAAVLLMVVAGQRRNVIRLTGDGRPVALPEEPMAASPGPMPHEDAGGGHLDPICRMTVGRTIAVEYDGGHYYFCSNHCRDAFIADPERYLQESCLVCRLEGDLRPLPQGRESSATWQGKTYRFCSEEHRQRCLEDPAGFFMHTMWGIPTWLYYAGIAGILIISFGAFEWRGRAGRGPERGPRSDLFRFRLLRRLLGSRLFHTAARLLLVAAFVLIIAAGLFGNQIPGKNIAPLLTWTIWWGGLIWLVLFGGKIWCYVCPWDAVSEWAERGSLSGRRRTRLGLALPWPRRWRNIWPATVLFIGLTWLELGFGVTMKPRATAWLGLLIFALTFGSIFLFERKSFCRYGCLVGRISGLYALFAPLELRARDREVCRTCRSHSCYHGNERGEGCPTFEHPAVMAENTYCTLCMECVATCDHDNIALRLRPWGSDLDFQRPPRTDEAYLALIMLSLTGFHGLTMTPAWRGIVRWLQGWLHLGETGAFSLGMTAVMVFPVLLYALLVAISHRAAGARKVGYREYFLRYAYVLLPIALFYHLAHNSEHLFIEGPKLIALLSDPFGWEWNLFGTAHWSPAPLIDMPTLWLIQIAFITIGHVYSLWAARRAAAALFPDSRATLRSQLPMLAAMILFSMMSLWLLKQPMEMRTSAM